MSNVIDRLGKYAGLDFDKQRTPSNPCITVREAIEVANHIAALTAKLAESQAEAMKYKLATEKNANALRECQRDAADLTKILANQQTEHAKQLAESESAVEQWKCNSRENKLIAEQAARELAEAQRDAYGKAATFAMLNRGATKAQWHDFIAAHTARQKSPERAS